MDTHLMGLREARRLGLLEAAGRKEVTNVQVAQALGLSVRQVRRLRRALERGGARALIHGNRGRVSGQRLAEPARQRVEALLQDPEAEFNDTRVADLLIRRGSHWRERRRPQELHPLDVPPPVAPRIALAPPTQRPERQRWRPDQRHPYKRLGHPEALDGHHPNRTRTKSLRS
jgi:hypothetical protein